ncbi:MAG: YfiR family protein [Nitrosomonas sp.]|nr:MAG: YfiR family protein [Nitrosomonas sp.]
MPGFVLPSAKRRCRKWDTGCRYWMLLLGGILLFITASTARSQEVSEYRLKVAFLYNFITYTYWPDQPNHYLTVCIHGVDPFGENLQYLHDKKINDADIVIRHTKNTAELSDCQVVFISKPALKNLADILDQVSGKPILTVSDSPGLSRQDVAISMVIRDGKIIFDANIKVAQSAGLQLSSELLRFAHEVYQ